MPVYILLHPTLEVSVESLEFLVSMSFCYSSLIDVCCPLISSLEELAPPELSCRDVFLPVHSAGVW